MKVLPDGRVQYQRGSPFPSQDRLYRVVATWPQPGLANTKREVFEAVGTFAEVLGKAQRRLKGARVSIRAVGVE